MSLIGQVRRGLKIDHWNQQCQIIEDLDKLWQNGKEGTKSELLGSGVNEKREIETEAGVKTTLKKLFFCDVE